MSDAPTTPSSGDAPTSTGADTSVSTTTTTTSTPDAGTTTDVNTSAAPSTADQGATTLSPGETAKPLSDRDGLLAAVTDAIKPKDGQQPAPGGAAATPAPGTTAAPGTGGDPNAPDPLDKDPDDAEMAALRPHVAGRVRKLLSQRDEARQGLETVKPELEQHRQLMGYLQHHKLAVDDVNLLLSIGAALRRGDYKGFLEGIEPYREIAMQAVGEAIAPDLLPQVENGSLSEDAAKQLTRTRMEATRHRVEAEELTKQATQRDTQVAQTQVHNAIVQWEQTVRTRDPDYALKEMQVRRTSQALIAELGRPTTVEGAIALAQRALDEVNAQYARIPRPPVQPTRPQPNGVSMSHTGAVVVPKSLMDAVNLGLERSRQRRA